MNRKNSKSVVKGSKMTEAQEYAATNAAYRAAIRARPNDYSAGCVAHDPMAMARALLAGKRLDSNGNLV